MSLAEVLQRADIWRGGTHAHEGHVAVPSGHAPLDQQLPGGGWPLGALTELLFDHPGMGELQLLMPAQARLTQAGRWLVWVTPPYLPYAPALAAAGVELSRFLYIDDHAPKAALWAMEQALRSGACGAVLGWLTNPDPRALRRLQLAAEAGGAMGVLFRPPQAARQASPAALRVQLTPAHNGLTLRILKRRGGWASQPIHWEPGTPRHLSGGIHSCAPDLERCRAGEAEDGSCR